MVIQVETYFVTSATLNGIWCIVTVSDLQQQQQQRGYVQFARILLYWTGIPRLVGQLGFRSTGQCQLFVYCVQALLENFTTRYF